MANNQLPMTNLKKGFTILTLLAGILILNATNALAYIIDGSLSDWGVTPGIYGSSDWTPNPGIFYNVEDNDPAVSYLGPGYGGQKFDAEAIYIDSDSTNLYFSIVTGLSKDGAVSGSTTYYPGDIALDFGLDGFYEYGIDTNGDGSFTKGTLYSVTSWGNGIWGGIGAPTNIITGSEILNPSDTNLVYNKTYYGNGNGNHYVIEGYMPISAFGSNWDESFKAHWSMTCANDFIETEVFPTPEPTSLALLGIGMFGILGMKKKKEVE